MEKEISASHIVNIVKRNSITITGVKKVENFNEQEFMIESNMGFIIIKGSNLEILKLDTYQGDITIKGKIDSLIYKEEKKEKNKEESIFNKLFK